MVEAALPEGTGSTTEDNQPQHTPNITDNSNTMGNNVTSETMAYLEERKGNESQPAAALRTDDDMVASTKTLSESNNTSGATGGDRNRILK